MISIEIIAVKFLSEPRAYYYNAFDEQNNKITVKKGDYVIAENPRGVCFGKVSMANREMKIDESETKNIVRVATEDDILQNERNLERASQASLVVENKVKDLKLDMSLVNVTYTHNQAKAIVYYTSENRVDFRDLVRSLSGTLKVRIEMRQISYRDESALVGGIGICGRVLCCCNHLRDLGHINMHMVKQQGISHSQSKLAGLCGSLKCCIKFESSTYEQICKDMPQLGATVNTPKGVGKVAHLSPMSFKVGVRLEDDLQVSLFACNDVTVIDSSTSQTETEEIDTVFDENLKELDFMD